MGYFIFLCAILFHVVFCRSLFVLMFFVFWSLYCLWSIKHYIENKWFNNMNTTTNRCEIGLFLKASSSCFTSGNRRVTFKRYEHYVIWKLMSRLSYVVSLLIIWHAYFTCDKVHVTNSEIYVVLAELFHSFIVYCSSCFDGFNSQR
jgi:hypothetical protein